MFPLITSVSLLFAVFRVKVFPVIVLVMPSLSLQIAAPDDAWFSVKLLPVTLNSISVSILKLNIAPPFHPAVFLFNEEFTMYKFPL